MAIYKEDIVSIELSSGTIHRSFLHHTIGSGDEKANRFGVRLFRDGEPVSAESATVTGLFMAPDGTRYVISETSFTGSTGTEGNKAYVQLPGICYAVTGQFTLAIKLSGGGVEGTMRIIDGTVDETGEDGAVVPTSTIPATADIIEAYEEAVAVMGGSVRFDAAQSLTSTEKTTARENIGAGSAEDVSELQNDVTDIQSDITDIIAGIAQEFSTETAYKKGEYVEYNGTLYLFTSDHTAGSWNNSHVTRTNIGDVIETAVRGSNVTISNDNKESICGSDCNNLPNNQYYAVSGGVTMLHEPFTTYYGILTIGKYIVRSAGDFQMATRVSDGRTMIRTFYNDANGWSPWRPIPNGLITFMAGNDSITTSNKASVCGGDCDGIQNNTFYGVAGDAGLSHEPFTNAYYSVATFGKYAVRSAGDFQLATRASDGTVKTRTYYNDTNGWSEWKDIQSFIAGATITDDNKADICGSDCNGIPNNSFFGVGGTTVLDHAPVSGSFYSIATFGKYPGTNRTAGDLQIASDTYNGRLIYRNYINSTNGWTPWKKIQETITDEAVYSGIGMFERFGVIGDSFASGPILPGTADPLNQNFSLSWGQILARKAGVTCVNYSEGGCGTYRFLDATNRDYSTHLMGKVLSDISGGNECGLYLLCMGINDSASWREFGDKHGGLDYLGSSADINTSDYTQNANSFWGNYGKIIQQLKQLTPGSRLVMCTYWRQDNSDQYAFSEYIQAIQDIATFFSIPCITLTDDGFFRSSFYINNLVSNHPTAPQYVGYANAIDRLLSRCIVSNYNYFKDYTDLP